MSALGMRAPRLSGCGIGTYRVPVAGAVAGIIAVLGVVHARPSEA